MKKTFLLFAMLLIASFNCNAQDVTEYVGKCKLYIFPNYDAYTSSHEFHGIRYTANVKYEDNTLYAKNLYYTAINIYDYSTPFNTYTTQHGMYVSFQYNFGKYHSHESAFSEQAMFRSDILGGSKYYAFTWDSGNLYLVDVKTDEIIYTFEKNIAQGTDFAIYVDTDEIQHERSNNMPSIWIINNGYVKIWNQIPVASSVKSISVDPDVQDKTFNISGIEIEDPQEGVYIKNGKKYIAK